MNIEKVLTAIRKINELHNLDDAVYAVRSRAAEHLPFTDENSWKHPDVKAYGEACRVLRAEGVIK